MRIKPIPKKLLPHTAIYKKYKGKDRYGDIEYEEPIEIKHVRIITESAKVLSTLTDEDRYTHVLFFDCVNSTPYPIEFKNDSLIVQNGVNYTLKKVRQPEEFNGKIHHFELELIS